MSADNWTSCPRCKTPGMLREDYGVGIEDGEFYVIYSGACRSTTCDFAFRFDFERLVS